MNMKTSPSSSSFPISLREKWLTRNGQMGKEGQLVRREQSERFSGGGCFTSITDSYNLCFALNEEATLRIIQAPSETY